MEKVPNGLSKSKVQFITNNLKADWTFDDHLLKKIKLSIVRFFLQEKLVGKDQSLKLKYLLYLAASCDPMHEVQFQGEDGLRRIIKPNFEDMDFIERLYSLYQGTPSIDPKSEKFHSPASYQLKVKIVDALIRSKSAADQYPQMIQVCFDCLYG